jgi:Zn-dependent protease
MTPTRKGSFHLLRLAGIDLYLHWSWFFVAALEIGNRSQRYSSLGWNVLEYLALFLIVLMHEFGHALACRQVGGKADQIVLWPLGGVAYVSPPQRPGAILWSIAAGPLVNVALIPVLILLGAAMRFSGGDELLPNAHQLLRTLWIINFGLLCFNLLPIYPLDGGQILRSVLWFWLGRARSLLVTSLIGFVGVALLVGIALLLQSVWLLIIAGFILLNCWSGLKQARVLAKIAALPRREGYQCPACRQMPPAGAYWLCDQCQTPFDSFANSALCPHCGARYAVTRCPECGTTSPFLDWERLARR